MSKHVIYFFIEQPGIHQHLKICKNLVIQLKSVTCVRIVTISIMLPEPIDSPFVKMNDEHNLYHRIRNCLQVMPKR